MNEPRQPTGAYEKLERARGESATSERALSEALAAARRERRSSRQRFAPLLQRAIERERSAKRAPWPRYLAVACAGIACAVSLSLLLARQLESPLPIVAEQAAEQSAPALPAGAIAGLGLFETEPGSAISVTELPHERRIIFGGSRLRAQVEPQSLDRPVVVVTPHLRLVVLGTRFDLYVDGTESRVDLIEGRVRVERGQGAVLLGGGESLSSSDGRFEPPPAVQLVGIPTNQGAVAPRAMTKSEPVGAQRRPTPGARLKACERRDLPRERIECLEPIARGTGMAAESALYTIGSLHLALGERGASLAALERFQSRFPESFLASEAMMLKLNLLVAAERRSEAVSLCGEFERRFPTDPRVAEVAAMRAALERGVKPPSSIP